MMEGFIRAISRLLLSFIVPVVSASGAIAADTSQAIFHPSFRTLKVTLSGDEFAPAVLMASDDESHIVISFDELSEERRYMRYELLHCDPLWRPDDLVASEFLSGFNEGVVDDYEYSRATLVHYVNYRIVIPNDQIRITASGNYLVRVYDENDPDMTLLQARFSVCEYSAEMFPAVTSLTDIDANDSHQQVSLVADLRHLDDLSDPYSELTLVVSQNERSDNEVVLTVPQRVGGTKVFFEHLRPLIFNAGNEYRRFETVSSSYPGMGVEHIAFHSPVYHYNLAVDAPRDGHQYIYDRTQHGRFFVREYSTSRPDTEADYGLVNFTLDIDEMVGGDIFIEGDITGRKFDPASRMVYNRATGQYEQSLLLKQGAYNYQYLFVPSGSLSGQTGLIEGDHFQTENEYTLKLYHRPRGSRYHRLVGVSRVTSGL